MAEAGKASTSHQDSPVLAALALCAAWLAIGSALVLILMVRAGHATGWRWWRGFSGGPEESLEDLERARNEAEQAVRETLARLAPAMTVEIASASVSVAGDMTGDVVEAGGELLESSGEAVEAIAEELPGGGVVNQMWDVVLMPGRFGQAGATCRARSVRAGLLGLAPPACVDIPPSLW